MYKIEKFLIERGYKLRKSYKSGVLLYQQYLESDFSTGTTIALFTKHEPKPEWEMEIIYPYNISLTSYWERDQEYIDRCKNILEEHIKECMQLEKELKSLDNPWEELL